VKLLLDTHLLLWAAVEPRRLSRKARALLLDEANRLAFSAASLWEIAIKSRLGRTDFDAQAGPLYQGLVANGYDEIPVRAAHAVQVAFLPDLHADPFDRLLVVQARAEGMQLVTADPWVAKYGAAVTLV
jgi:PIN domain nuclease of toxin-antitoxin system